MKEVVKDNYQRSFQKVYNYIAGFFFDSQIPPLSDKDSDGSSPDSENSGEKEIKLNDNRSTKSDKNSSSPEPETFVEKHDRERFFRKGKYKAGSVLIKHVNPFSGELESIEYPIAGNDNSYDPFVPDSQESESATPSSSGSATPPGSVTPKPRYTEYTNSPLSNIRGGEERCISGFVDSNTINWESSGCTNRIILRKSRKSPVNI